MIVIAMAAAVVGASIAVGFIESATTSDVD